MTRVLVYASSLAVFTVASVLTLVSIIIPRWVSYRDTTPHGTPITYTYGLHRRCSSTTGECTHFPTYEDCHGTDRYFCSMWRSVGFLMSFAVVLEGAIILAFITILMGGRTKRESGWKIMSFLLLLVAMMQCTSMALVAYLYDWDDRFFIGWRLDISWIFTTVSWSVAFLLAVGLALSGLLIPPENGYLLLK
ncbi:hypothetical protein FN846DRAFT_900216 [Sphaerosporella brunnea]|uniref:Uncharacterized protein n=1 Tax=Sphaerosporella brunnea TaxID=1250544 RepID=A0A5J5EP37_9PEZI|nr:hypothetical protein FN846DRAFT_900216 [Sphaerosporella brunnea]